MGKSQTWFSDTKNLDWATKRHNKWKDHVGAAVRLKLLGRMPVDQTMDRGLRLQTVQRKVKVFHNRDSLKCLLGATAYLGMQGLAFRGHTEEANLYNKGNFREIAEVIA